MKKFENETPIKVQKYFLSEIISKFSFLHFFSLLTVYCLLTTTYTFSQTITKSSLDKVASRFSDYEILGRNNSGIIVHYFGNNESELVAYDAQLKPTLRKMLPFKGKGIALENFILLNDKILAFYTTNGDNYQYFKLKIIDEKLNIPDETILLDSISLTSIGNTKAFYTKTSPDKSKILTFSILKTKAAYFIRFNILSDSIRRLNKNVFSVTEANNAALKSIKINNEGNVIAIIGNESRYDLSDYNYERFTTLTFNRSTNTIGEQVMQNQDYVYKNLISEVSTKREIAYITASYKSIKNKNDIGIAYQIIDFRTNTVLLNSTMPFNDEILQKSQTNDFKTWQDKAALVKPKRIVPRSDGGFVLITEGEYKFTKAERLNNFNNTGFFNNSPVMPSVRYIDQNHFYDIGVFSINNDGTVDWQTNMPKAQVSENDDGYYSSFAFFEANNVLKFLYNEDFYNTGNFSEYNVNPNGLTKRQSVMNSEKQDVVLVPMKAKQLDGNTIIIPSEQKRNVQLVLFQY
jgi:hypothetical protein